MLKQPSASVNPTNHSRNCFESLGILEDLDKSMGLLFGNLQLIYFSTNFFISLFKTNKKLAHIPTLS